MDDFPVQQDKNDYILEKEIQLIRSSTFLSKITPRYLSKGLKLLVTDKQFINHICYIWITTYASTSDVD